MHSLTNAVKCFKASTLSCMFLSESIALPFPAPPPLFSAAAKARTPRGRLWCDEFDGQALRRGGGGEGREESNRTRRQV